MPELEQERRHRQQQEHRTGQQIVHLAPEDIRVLLDRHHLRGRVADLLVDPVVREAGQEGQGDRVGLGVPGLSVETEVELRLFLGPELGS